MRLLYTVKVIISASKKKGERNYNFALSRIFYPFQFAMENYIKWKWKRHVPVYLSLIDEFLKRNSDKNEIPPKRSNATYHNIMI